MKKTLTLLCWLMAFCATQTLKAQSFNDKYDFIKPFQSYQNKTHNIIGIFDFQNGTMNFGLTDSLGNEILKPIY